MPKQVRIRRGSTAQHAGFTGAEGEITFDTTKKILIVHDGVTPGGRPLEGWLKLDPGQPLLVQEIKSCLSITGGDEDTVALSVTNPVSVQELTVNGGAQIHHFSLMVADLPYAPTVNLDFRGFGAQRLELTGDVAFTTSNLGFGRQLLVRIMADGSARTLSFPAGWKFVGTAAPASLGANKTALMQLWSFGITNNDLVAEWLAN